MESYQKEAAPVHDAAGLLNYLWEECDLNIWRPGMGKKRGHWTVKNEISKFAKEVMFKQGRRLSDFLFIPNLSLDSKVRKEASSGSPI
jgi:hypothetical protein